MQEQPSKLTKSKSEASHNFWQSIIKKIYAPNADVISLHRRDVLVAFKRLQKAKPDYGFGISYKQESKGYRTAISRKLFACASLWIVRLQLNSR